MPGHIPRSGEIMSTIYFNGVRYVRVLRRRDSWGQVYTCRQVFAYRSPDAWPVMTAFSFRTYAG
jgi:hypothetical protein